MSIYTKTHLSILSVILCTLLAVFFIYKPSIEHFIATQDKNNAHTALNLIDLNIQDQFNILVNYEVELIKKRRKLLEERSKIIISALNVYNTLYKSGDISIEDVKSKALDWIKSNNASPQIAIMDDNLIGLYHPEPTMTGKKWIGYRDLRGNDAFHTIHSILERQENIYSLVYMKSPHSKLMRKYLTYSTSYPQWGWTVTSFIPMDDVESEVRQQFTHILKHLRGIFTRSEKDLPGRLALMDANGSMLIPPNEPGLTSLSQGVPLRHQTLVQIKDAAAQEKSVKIPTSAFFQNDPTGTYVAISCHFVPLNWYIIYLIPQDTLEKHGKDIALRQSIIISIVVIAICILLFLIFTHTIRPIKKLSHILFNEEERAPTLSIEQYQKIETIEKKAPIEIRRICKTIILMDDDIEDYTNKNLSIEKKYTECSRRLHDLSIAFDIKVAERVDILNSLRDDADAASIAHMDHVKYTVHKIRTHLHILLEKTHALKQMPLSLETEHEFQALEDIGNTLFQITNSLVNSSEDMAAITLEKTPFHLGNIVDSVCATMTEAHKTKGLRFVNTIRPEIDLHRQGDPDKLRSILLNLLSNTANTTSNENIRIEVFPSLSATNSMEKNNILFFISDTNIAFEDVPETFKQQFNLPWTPSHLDKNTSLDIKNAAHLIAAMGGGLHIFTDATKGTAALMILHLPRVSPALPAPTRPNTPPLRILAVDDNEPNLHLLRLYFEDENILLETAQNGKDALKKYKTSSFDVIFMDIEMPVMDGLETTRRIRQFEKKHQLIPVPIIALTAHALEQYRTRCKDAGCTDFIAKPFKKAQLLATLNTLIPQQETSSV